MTNIRNNSVTSLIFLAVFLLGTAHLAAASEITGTLSSDGSNETVQQTSASSNETSVAATAQNSGQLQGSVVQGRDENSSLTVADTATSNSTMLFASLASIVIAAMVFFFWLQKAT